MAGPTRVQETMTLEEFLKQPEEKPYLEYIDGRIEAKVSPQFKHSLITLRLMEHLNRFAEPRGLGLAVPELRCSFDGRSIVPDVVFVLEDHIPVDERGDVGDVNPRAPGLHVEIVSPEQSVRGAREKLAHSTSNGCALGWLIHPEQRWVEVYRPGRPPERLDAGGVLEGDPVLPGYRLPVAEVFGWLRRRNPRPPATGNDLA